MRFLKKMLLKWIREEERRENDLEDTIPSTLSSRGSPIGLKIIDDDPLLMFKIYSAENGKILEFNKYDNVKDRNFKTVYIIGKDEDISQKVSKCLSLELLR